MFLKAFAAGFRHLVLKPILNVYVAALLAAGSARDLTLCVIPPNILHNNNITNKWGFRNVGFISVKRRSTLLLVDSAFKMNFPFKQLGNQENVYPKLHTL